MRPVPNGWSHTAIQISCESNWLFGLGEVTVAMTVHMGSFVEMGFFSLSGQSWPCALSPIACCGPSVCVCVFCCPKALLEESRTSQLTMLSYSCSKDYSNCSAMADFFQHSYFPIAGLSIKYKYSKCGF